jgi:ABC-2 type transport system permease protein
VIRLAALLRKELAVLFGSPLAWLTLAGVGFVTALLFFDHLRIYNQILFLYSTSTMGGFATDTIPTYVNLRDQVFLPVMETLALTLVGLVPLVTMRSFAEERASGTDELLGTTRLTPGQIVLGKFLATWLLIALMMGLSFVYPAASVVRAGLGLPHLLCVYLGLFSLAIALASIGLACSAFASSQLLAAISAYAIAFLLYDFRWLAQLVPEGVATTLDALSMHPRFGSFAEGIVRAADLAYFAGCALVALALARLAWDQQRVR